MLALDRRKKFSKLALNQLDSRKSKNSQGFWLQSGELHDES